MTFQPIVPLGGYGGWAFLNRTLDDQTKAFSAAPLNERDTTYFRENIGTVLTAEALVSDYQMLRVALGAFGLQDDLPNRAFVRAILEEGTSDSQALSNRLADKRYQAFSEAFGFGEPALPKTLEAGFADRILARFERQEFERAVGEQNNELRVALNLQRELPELAAEGLDADTAWLSILGNPPLRAAFETALGLPDSFGLIDLDQQLDTFRDRARSIFGSDDIATLATEAGIDDIVGNYLGRAQLGNFSSTATSASIAVTLLTPLVR
ncbi:MAG: DUF1217 domain-containing protein [Pseudomonadota bacterium]